MSELKLPKDFYLSLTEFLLHVKHQIINLSEEFGLTSMQALTLLLISDGEPQPMNALSKLYNCDASNITGIIDGLEEKKLVSRQAHPHDRRIKIIKLEPAGIRLNKKLAAKLSAQSPTLLNGLDNDEAQQLAKLIRKAAAANRRATCPKSQ